MLSDSAVHSLFADSPENSPKKEKPKSKPKTKKERKKIAFDPSIFDQNDEVTADFNNDFNNFMIPQTSSTIMPLEFSNLLSKINLYLNSQLNFLKDDFMNQLLSLIDTTKNEEAIINSFLNDISASIKESIILFDEQSTSIANAFTPNQFDAYSERYHKIFSDAKEFSQANFDTSSIKSLRNEINNSYNKIKQNLIPYPQQIQSEILELSMIHQNYQAVFDSYDIHAQSRKKREMALECKHIEQEILSETNSNQIESIKEEKAQFARILEKNEQNQEITSPKIEDLIQSLKNAISTKYKGSQTQINEQYYQIKQMKKDLQILRAKYNYLQQSQVTIGMSSVSIAEQNQMPMNQKMNTTYAYGDSRNQNNTVNKNPRDSYAKVRKGLNMLMKEQNRNLENTSTYLKTIQENNRSEIVDRLRRSFYT